MELTANCWPADAPLLADDRRGNERGVFWLAENDQTLNTFVAKFFSEINKYEIHQKLHFYETLITF